MSSDLTAPATRHLTLRPSAGVIVAGLIGGAALASGVALTATSGWLIVRASERPQILTLLVAIVAVRAFGMARPALRYAERLRSHDVALRDLARARTATYAALVPLTPARLGRRSRADVLSGVVDDLTDVVDAQVRVTVPIVAATVVGTLATVLTALVSPAAGLVLAGLMAAAAAACWRAWHSESESQQSVLAARSEVVRVADLVSRQAMSLAAVGGQAAAARWLETAHDRLRVAVDRQARGRAFLTGALLVATGVACVANAVLASRSDLGGPVTALLVVTPVALGEALAGLTDAVRALARAQAARDRLAGLLSQPPAVSDPRNRQLADTPPVDNPGNRQRTDTPPVLELAGVAAVWVEGEPALRHTDLVLEPGSRTAITGANGSGKSTLLAVLARHLDPSAGSYLLDGRDVTTLPLEDVRSAIAILDDEPHLFATNLRENLRLARPDATDLELETVLAQANLSDWYAGLADGLDTPLGVGRLGVSGGERARLGLARVLLSDRPVVLLDEPVAHLDHATALDVVSDALAATEGRTVVMVSHRPEGLDDFERVIDLTPPLTKAG